MHIAMKLIHFRLCMAFFLSNFMNINIICGMKVK